MRGHNLSTRVLGRITKKNRHMHHICWGCKGSFLCCYGQAKSCLGLITGLGLIAVVACSVLDLVDEIYNSDCYRLYHRLARYKTQQAAGLGTKPALQAVQLLNQRF